MSFLTEVDDVGASIIEKMIGERILSKDVDKVRQLLSQPTISPSDYTAMYDYFHF